MSASASFGIPVCSAYRFNAFEVRVGDQVLLHRGKQVSIQKLPFRMLLVLLERHGQIVTREELRNRLWGDSTFVDFDTNLRVAAAKLREALGDSASEPTYLETVPKQGYRFLVEPTPVFDLLAAPLDISPQLPPEPLEVLLPIQTPEKQDRETTRPFLYRSLVLAVALVATTAFFYWEPRRPLIGSEDKVAIGSFVNRSSSHDYDAALSLPFRIKLEESSFLNLVSGPQLALKGDAPTLSNELQACAEAHAQILLRGELVQGDERYEVRVFARRCPNGKLLATETASANSQMEILPALSLASNEMRRRLGEPESSIHRFNVPLDQATTNSMGALNAFTLGEEKHRSGHGPEAIPDYKLAIALDPQFAIAYANLGRVYGDSGETALSQTYYEKAFNLRERTTDRERFYIAAGYYSYATGEIWQAIKTYQLWMALYPRDVVPVNNLASEYLRLGQAEQAMVLARKAIQIHPSLTQPYATLAAGLSMSGKYVALEKLCDTASGTSDLVGLHLACYDDAFLRNDAAEMQRQLQWGHGKPMESTLLDEAARVAMSQGRLKEAEHLFAQAKRSAFDHGATEYAALLELEEAQFDADYGFVGHAKQQVREALSIESTTVGVQAQAALVLALTGDTAHARAEARQAKEAGPLNTMVNSLYLATAQAAIALREQHPEAAIQDLQTVQPYELCSEMLLSPIYYRGRAYLQQHRWHEAATEFQMVLDHRAISPASPYLALSQLELGQAEELSGNQAQALRAYRAADAAWVNANVGFLPLRQLRAHEHRPGTR